MTKRTPHLWVLLSLGLMHAVAFAQSDQPPKAGADKAAPPAASAAGADEATEAPGDDLGEPPPPRADESTKVQPSPLTPRPDEMPKDDGAPAPQELDGLLSEIAALRSRVAALTTTLFKSNLRVIVETEGAQANIESFVVTLDDGVIFTGDKGFLATDERVVYEHAVAPGHHTVGVELERTDLRGREFATWQASKFSVIVPDGKQLEAHLVLEDDSDMAADFPDDQDGEYELSVRLRARVAEE